MQAVQQCGQTLEECTREIFLGYIARVSLPFLGEDSINASKSTMSALTKANLKGCVEMKKEVERNITNKFRVFDHFVIVNPYYARYYKAWFLSEITRLIKDLELSIEYYEKI